MFYGPWNAKRGNNVAFLPISLRLVHTRITEQPGERVNLPMALPMYALDAVAGGSNRGGYRSRLQWLRPAWERASSGWFRFFSSGSLIAKLALVDSVDPFAAIAVPGGVIAGAQSADDIRNVGGYLCINPPMV